MTHPILSELLERSADRVPESVPPVADILRAGRTARRRRRAAVVVATLAVALVAAGLGIARAHRAQAPLLDRSTEVPSAPAGMKWVGVGRQVVAVPAGWPVIPDVWCPGLTTDYVTILTALDPSKPTTGPVCPRAPESQPQHIVLVTDPHHLRIDDTGEAGPIATLPPGWAAVPLGDPRINAGMTTATSVVAALKADGFRSVLRPAARDGQYVTTDPEIGTPARIGSTVVVYDHTALPRTGLASGHIVWTGGPAPGTARPHRGVVHVVSTDGVVDQHMSSTRGGRWTVALPPGIYRVSASSPGYLGGRADACAATSLVTVTYRRITRADVYCQLR